MTQNTPSSRDKYRVGTLEKALTILHLIECSRNPLRIHEIVDATRIERGTVFRVLYTLEKNGYVERSSQKAYRITMLQRRTRLAYFGPLADTPFRRDVTASIQRATSELRVEVLMLDNTEDGAEQDLKNARFIIE